MANKVTNKSQHVANNVAGCNRANMTPDDENQDYIIQQSVWQTLGQITAPNTATFKNENELIKINIHNF